MWQNNFESDPFLTEMEYAALQNAVLECYFEVYRTHADTVYSALFRLKHDAQRALEMDEDHNKELQDTRQNTADILKAMFEAKANRMPLPDDKNQP